MNHKISLPVVIVFIGFLFSGCALHNGYILNSSALSSNNFTYVERGLTATSQAAYIFGIGGLSRQTIVEEAKSKILQQHPLKDNQALANITVNWKYIYVVPFAIVHRCTVTADIVEFK